MKAAVRMSCLDENTVAALLDGLLSVDARADVDAHVDACEGCRLLLSNVAPLLGPPPSVAKPTPTQYTISQTVELDRIKWNASMRVGSVLKEKWRLDRLLGVGGTAAVYEATHKNHGGRVAIKLIHAGLELNPSDRRRFLREGYAANAVGHAGIVRVIDDDVDEDGSIFLVSELAEGETLQARLVRLGRLPVEDVLLVADAVLDVLAAAHERGIIHRDIKPENILAGVNGETKLLDFGMALVREATYESTDTTSRGLALGTPAFMAPEQALGLTEEVGPASDIWAVGATMFTLMTGRLVHDAQTVTDALRRAVKLPAPPLASVLPDVPEEVGRLVDRALEFSKDARWSSASLMRSATRDALGAMALRGDWTRGDSSEEETRAFHGAPMSTSGIPPNGAFYPPSPPVAVAAPPSPPPLLVPVSEVDERSRARTGWAIAGAALLGSLVIVAWLATRESPSFGDPDPPTIGEKIPTSSTAIPSPSGSPSENAAPSTTAPGAYPTADASAMPAVDLELEPEPASAGLIPSGARTTTTKSPVKPRPSSAPSSAPPPVASSWLDRRTR